jgi:hypothetical protein
MQAIHQVQQKIREDNEASKVQLYLSKVNSTTYLLFVRPYPQAKLQLLKEIYSPEQALREAAKLRLQLEKSLQSKKKEKSPPIWKIMFHQFKCYLSLLE